MKKYSWISIIIFAVALITCVVIASKNEAVRDVFMKSVNDIDYYAGQMAIEAKKAFCGNI